MPQDGTAAPPLSLLPLDDLHRVAQQAASLGIRKVRVTGGEPLLRPGIVPFLSRISSIPGIREVVLTTNGILLADMAQSLREAGVKRLNISMDSLKQETFAAITGGGSLERVLAGIDAAEQAGFPAPQINVVVLRGTNDNEVLDFAKLAMERRLTVRFIEYMPVMGHSDSNALYVKCEEILNVLAQHYRLTPQERIEGSGPARYFRLDDSSAKIGVISPISNHFCASCNRIRITADGQARGCLFSKETIDLKPSLLEDDKTLLDVLRRIIREKPTRHDLLEVGQAHGFVPMSAIGG